MAPFLFLKVHLRRNHNTSKGKLPIIKVFAFIIALSIIFFLIKDKLFNTFSPVVYKTSNDGESYPTTHGEIIDHAHFKLSYIEEHEQAEWVSYMLTRDMLRAKNVPRSKRFEKDDAVSTGSADYYDYRGSGYTRGHLAPAGDMAHSFESMQTSFLMSNISPQIRAFNNGVWKELEEQVRDWTFQNEEIHIVTGPVLTNKSYLQIGKSKVSVPDFFYKALLIETDKKRQGIAFVIPHQLSDQHLHTYAVSIDSLEQLLQVNLFHDLDHAARLESTYDLKSWPVSEARYKLRKERWNYE